MSGGHLNYRKYYLLDICSELGRIVKQKNTRDLENDDLEEENTWEYPEAILVLLEEARDYTDLVSTMLHNVDYLLSGDIGEHSLLEEWALVKNRLSELHNKYSKEK